VLVILASGRPYASGKGLVQIQAILLLPTFGAGHKSLEYLEDQFDIGPILSVVKITMFV
jgi:hypothetical protein